MKPLIMACLAFPVLLGGSALAASKKAPPQAQPAAEAPAAPAAPLAPSAGLERVCQWASRAYSEGALFCIGPKTALQCADAAWRTQTFEACNNAAVIDAK